MSSPYPVASLLGSLLFLMRHEPHATEHHAALLAALRTVRGGGGLALEAVADGLRINAAVAALDAPGVALVSEQMLLHGIRALDLPARLGDQDLLHLTTVLAAFPGTYPGFTDVLNALGGTASRVTLTRVTSEFEVFKPMPKRSRALPEGEGVPENPLLEMPDILRDDADRFELAHEVSLDSTDAGDGGQGLTGGTTAAPRSALDVLVKRGRDAIARNDWEGLLDLALEMLEAESEAPTELESSTYRIELRRLLPRKQLIEVAGFVLSDRKQDAVMVLRRFGTESTEILMGLLVDATSISERRAYYSAISQITGGTEPVVFHLSHAQWYVVRNAADLCGEMALADAVPELVKQCQHPDERVRKAIAEALGKIGTPAAMEGLRRMLADTVSAVRVKALAHLSGRQARGMTGALGKLLEREEDVLVQQEALLALGRIATPDAVAILGEWVAPRGKLLGRKPLAARLAAVRGLVLAGPAALDVLAALQRDDSPEVSQAASRAIDALKP